MNWTEEMIYPGNSMSNGIINVELHPINQLAHRISFQNSIYDFVFKLRWFFVNKSDQIAW